MTNTTLQAPATTKTSTFTGSAVDVSGLAKPCDVSLSVTALTAAKVAHFQLQSSADNFVSDIVVEKQWNVIGPYTPECPFNEPPVHYYDMPGIRVGVTSAKLRIALTYIDGSASVTYGATMRSA